MHSQNHFQSFKGGLRLTLALAFGLGLAVLFLSQASAQPIGEVLGEGAQADHPAPVSQDGGEAGDPDRVPDPAWISLVESLSQPPGDSPAGMTLDVNLLTYAIAGRVLLPDVVSLSVMREGIQIANGQVLPVPDARGFFFIADPQWDFSVCTQTYCFESVFRPGDVVAVYQAENVISVTLPVLTALAYPDTDLISGSSLPGTTLTIYGFSSIQPPIIFTQTVTSGSTGAYQADFSSIYDLRPADRGYVVVEIDDARRAYIPFVAPQLIVEVGGRNILGLAVPNSSGLFTVTNLNGQVMWIDGLYSDETGQFSSLVYPNPVDYGPLQEGYQVQVLAGGQLFSTTVQMIAVSADLQQGQVQGHVNAYQTVLVKVLTGPIGQDDNFWFNQIREEGVTTATAEGDFSLTLPLQTADFGFAFITTPKGHQTFARFVLPWVHAVLGQPWQGYSTRPILMGQVNDFSGLINMSVTGPSGYLKDRTNPWKLYNGYYEDRYVNANSGLVLESGDILNLASSTGDLLYNLTLPLLTAIGDPQNDTVSGQAPPGTRLSVEILGFYSPGPFDLHGGGPIPDPIIVITATAQGTFLADFSGMVELNHNTMGRVSMITADGNLIQRIFIIPIACPGTIDRLPVGSNYLVMSTCPDYSLVVRAPDGNIKFSQQFKNQPQLVAYYYLFVGYYQPVYLLPGDQITLVGGGKTYELVVPRLDVSFVPGGNQVYGHAPPDSELELSYIDLFSQAYFTATANHQGTFQVNVPGIVDFDPESHVQVSISEEDLIVLATGLLNGFDVSLYRFIDGRLSAGVPYTLTWTVTHSETQKVITGTTDEAGHLRVYPVELDNLPLVPQPGDILHLEAPQTHLDMDIPVLTANVERPSARVSGTAPPGAKLRVMMSSEYYYEERYQEVVASAGGVYMVEFPEFAGKSVLFGNVSLINPPGNRAILEYRLPSWHITIGATCLSGYAGAIGQPASLVHKPASGKPSENVPIPWFSGSGYFDTCLSYPLESNDELEFAGPGGVMQFTIPLLSAHYDSLRNVIEGMAPSDADLLIKFNTSIYYYVMERHTQASDDGHYGVDISDLDLNLVDSGYMLYVDGNGDEVRLDTSLETYTFMPLLVLSGP